MINQAGKARSKKFVMDDGGRAAAGYKGQTGDCVCRSIAIATGKPYQEVYDALWSGLREHAETKRDRVAKRINRGGGRRGTSPRNGVNRKVYEKYLGSLGWKFTPTMQIGSGCRVHLRKDELPSGRLIVSVSKHMTAVIDGVIHDTHDPSRDGTRCVYGYFSQEETPRRRHRAAHRRAIGNPAPKEKEPNMRLLDRLFSRRSRTGTAAAEEVLPTVMSPLAKAKPQLISIDQAPFGSVLDFVMECLETAGGERVALWRRSCWPTKHRAVARTAAPIPMMNSPSR